MNQENNDQKQLADFFSQEYQSLKSYVTYKLEGDLEGDAEDVVQDVALKLFSRKGASPIDNIAGFVYRSIKNRIIDLMRSRKTMVHDEERLETLWTDFSERFYGKSTQEYTEDIKGRLKTALAQLKPKYRDIIIAVDFEGYTYREISEQTGIPKGTLMSQRHRALSLLGKKLERMHQNSKLEVNATKH